MPRVRTPLLICSLILGASGSVYSAEKARTAKHEAIEWCDVWMPDMTRSDLPRVLLIGDSITRAYYKDVEQNLKGRAYCARMATSAAVGDPALIMQLHAFLSEAKFDVIHFNIGMHGWTYSEDDYGKYLPKVLKVIRKDAPGARLIWASTTPVRKDRRPGPSDDRIRARNEIAKKYFARKHIPIDDLYTLMAPHSDLHSDDVHFNSEGAALQARQVAAEIVKLLPQ
jgi:lysophospholipase L1-like esterase